MEENKVAIITGASRGIGKEVAKKFAENKYNLVLNYASDNVDVESLKKEFEQYKVEIECIKANVANFSECEQMVNSSIEKYGKIDVLVNNAGITRDNLLMRMKEQDFDDVINVNLKGTFNMTKNVVPFMMKKKVRKDSKCFISSRNIWKCRTMQLFCFKSWNNRLYEIYGKRTCK